MARTPLGLLQRTAQGRFMYGRPSNYRLQSCMTSPVNYNGSEVTPGSLTGLAPLDEVFTLATLVPTPIIPDMQSHWPAPAAGGMSSPNPAGGIAIQPPGYPRTGSAGTPIIAAVSASIDFDDGTADSAVTAYPATIHHTYDPGAFQPVANSVDGLGRVTPTITLPILVSIASQTISGFGAFGSHTYGDAPISLAGVTGGASGNPVVFTSGNTAVAMVSGSTVTIVGAGSAVITATQAGDTDYAAATPVPQTLTVATAALSVTANAGSRAYGAANPTFTGVIVGVIGSDVITATYASTASTLTDIGVYGPADPLAITPTLVDPGSRLSNYTVTSTKGTLTLTAKALSFTANAASRLYGAANPTFTGTIIGVVSGDTITATYASSAVALTDVGVYGPSDPLAITPTPVDPGSRLGNYTVTITKATLTLTVAPLSVTADDASRAFGAANPVFTGVIVGVISGDTITATYASAADGSTPVGVYGPATPEAITPTLVDPGTRLGNYAVTSTNGTLTIT